MAEESGQLVDLPEEILDAQMSMVDLILAMFSLPGEVEITSESIELMAQLCDKGSDRVSAAIPVDFSFILSLAVDNAKRIIQLQVLVPLKADNLQASEPPPLTYLIRQPPWMTRAEVAELSSSMPKSDIFGAIEYLQDQSTQYGNQESVQEELGGDVRKTQAPDQALVRVLFYFPSLSTREKRMDLVQYASDYQLTGFVLAGKPGVLCLEGVSSKIDAYMNYIKMHSWGDIPSHQKKVSERYREGGRDVPIQRCFADMVEITDSLGERKGKRNNRGDMKALETWMMEKGLGDSFQKVIMQR